MVTTTVQVKLNFYKFEFAASSSSSCIKTNRRKSEVCFFFHILIVIPQTNQIQVCRSSTKLYLLTYHIHIFFSLNTCIIYHLISKFRNIIIITMLINKPKTKIIMRWSHRKRHIRIKKTIINWSIYHKIKTKRTVPNNQQDTLSNNEI